MTSKCVRQVYELNKSSLEFQEMSVEQLLLSAINGSAFGDVLFILQNTDWDKYKKELKEI